MAKIGVKQVSSWKNTSVEQIHRKNRKKQALSNHKKEQDFRIKKLILETKSAPSNDQGSNHREDMVSYTSLLRSRVKTAYRTEGNFSHLLPDKGLIAKIYGEHI